MPNTTNFNWATPADTDLVKDGALAIRTLGNSIDTSLVDLKGGTTGQVLTKASNADMDFSFTTPNVGDITEVQAGVGISIASGTGPIPVITNSSTDLITTAGDVLYGTAADTVARLGIGTAGQVLKVNSGATAPEWAVDPTTDVVTTAGDLIYGTAADTVARLGIGTAGQVLKVNSGATAPEWGAAASGALTLIKTQTVGTSVTSVTVNDAFSTTYENYLITYTGGSNAANNADIQIKFGAATSNYKFVGIYMATTSSTVNSFATNSSGAITVGGMSGNGAASFIYVMNPYETKRTAVIAHTSTTHSDMFWQDYKGFLDDATSYTSFIISSGNAMTGGVIRVYGYQKS
jgi:hypothetical protein